MNFVDKLRKENHYRHLVIDMIDRQKKLNDQMAGEGWEEKDLPWYRYARIELAELIIHHNSFKHWKKPDPDLEQARLELVDVWFFLMSQALADSQPEDLVSFLPPLCVRRETKPSNPGRGVVDLAEDVQRATFEGRVDTVSLVHLMYALGIDLEQLYVLYLAKHALNQLRDNHGQKEGRYVKEWFGREDNVAMQEEVLDNPATLDMVMGDDDPAQAIYRRLEVLYEEALEAAA